MKLPPSLRRPAWAVIASLAVSVALLTATFNIAYAALYRAPGFVSASRVVMLYTTHRASNGATYQARWSYKRYDALRAATRSLTRVAAYTASELTLNGRDETELVQGEFVTPSYFAVLGARLEKGRAFVESENEPAARAPVAIISHSAWKRLFGGRADVIGATLRVNGAVLTIVGVMAEGFRGLTDRATLWLPTALAPTLTYPEYLTTGQDFISVVGLVAPGASPVSVTNELARLTPQLYGDFPSADRDSTDRPSAVARTINDARVLPQVRNALLVLLAAVALLHLLAVANATSFLLGRSFARAREYAVRTALGARGRALRGDAYRDGAMQGVLGGVMGMVIGVVGGTLLPTPLELWGARNFYGALAAFADPGFNLATVAFGGCLTIVTALLIGSAPAIVAVRSGWVAALRDGARGASAGGLSLRRPSTRAVLVACEVSLAMVLCTVGGLVFDGFLRMKGTPIGVNADGVLTFTVRPSEARVPVSEASTYITRMLVAIRSVPGVRRVSVDGGAPVAGTARSTLHIVGRASAPNGDAPPILRHYVAPGHFETLGIALVDGRDFSERDDARAPAVTVISETAAHTFWPNESPIGKRVWFGGGSGFNSPDSSAEVIGVVRDVVYEPLDVTTNRASFYTSYAQFSYGWRVYFVRAERGIEPLSLVPAIRRAVRRVDADVPLGEVRDLPSLIGASWSRQRADVLLYSTFAFCALGIAMAGIFAVVAHSVSQRTREVGIRTALGARPRTIVAMVLRDGLTFPLFGAVLGGVLAVAGSGALRALVPGIAGVQPRVLAVSGMLMMIAASLASLVPAVRATRCAPSDALRSE